MKVVTKMVNFLFVTIPHGLKALTTELLQTSASGMWPTQPYPESFALKSLSICMLAVENSLYIACKKTEKLSAQYPTAKQEKLTCILAKTICSEGNRIAGVVIFVFMQSPTRISRPINITPIMGIMITGPKISLGQDLQHRIQPNFTEFKYRASMKNWGF